MKMLLYCTKSKPMLRVAKPPLLKYQNIARTYTTKDIPFFTEFITKCMYEANGKIIGECDFEVEKFRNLL